MMKSLLIFTALIILIGANASFGQGDFLQKGQSGYQLVGAYARSANEYSISANAGYSIDGTFDLGFSIGRLSVGEGIISCTYYGPSLIFHTNKQGAGKFPISISYLFQYGISSYSKKSLYAPENKIELNGTHLKLGIVLYNNIKVDPAFIIQPNILIGYANNDINYTQRSQTYQIVSGGGMNIGLGFSMLIGEPTKSGFRIDIGFSTYKSETAFSISFGLIKAPDDSQTDW